MSGRFLFVTWDAGGNVPPALVLARRLLQRGHSVTILGPRTLRERIEATGARFCTFPEELEWDDSKGRSLEDQPEFWIEILAGTLLADAVMDELGREPTDVVVVDCMLENALAAAEKSGLLNAALVHVLYQPWAAMQEPRNEWWEDEFNTMNDTRAKLGLAPIPRRHFIAELWARPGRALVLVPREFDAPGKEPSANVRYVGPLLEKEASEYAWDLPWPADEPTPLIVISLGTTYQQQEEPLRRILEAVASVPARRVLTLGHALPANAIDVPHDVIVRDWVPLDAVLQHASVVVTHAGLGTVSACLARGVPMLCIPLGREQPNNARRVEACNAGLTIEAQASSDEIRDALVEVLESEQYRNGASEMAAVIADYERRDGAVAELETLVRAAGRS